MCFLAHDFSVPRGDRMSGMRPEIESVRTADRLLATAGRWNSTAGRLARIQDDSSHLFFVVYNCFQRLFNNELPKNKCIESLNEWTGDQKTVTQKY